MASNHPNADGPSNQWPQNALNPDGSPATVLWSEEFECYTVNGILAPLPLSAVPLERNEMEGAPGSPSRASVGATQPGGSNNKASSSSSSRTRRSSKTSPGDHPIKLELFKFVDANAGPEEYLLVLYETDSDFKSYTRINVHQKNQNWIMNTQDYSKCLNRANMVPVLEDPNPTVFKKRSDLGLQERLVGWQSRTTPRPSGTAVDVAYYHQGVKHRSFYEMSAFVIYANRKMTHLTLLAAGDENKIVT